MTEKTEILPKRDKEMVEAQKELEALCEATYGLGFEDFYNIMVSVKTITESYGKLSPNAKVDNYAEMWLQIVKLTNRPDQDEQKVVEAYKRLYPNATNSTFEAVKGLTKIDT
jgi:hypothetical protein